MKGTEPPIMEKHMEEQPGNMWWLIGCRVKDSGYGVRTFGIRV